MAWRWRQVFRIGGWIRATTTRSGIGWSWGLPGFRVGISPNGRKWISIGIPGTGVYFFRNFGNSKVVDRRPEFGNKTVLDDSRKNKPSEIKRIKRWDDIR